MRRVLIVSENDFDDINKGLPGLKKDIIELERNSDDIFFINNNKEITCFKARNGKVGMYTFEDLNQYLIENKWV